MQFGAENGGWHFTAGSPGLPGNGTGYQLQFGKNADTAIQKGKWENGECV